PPRPLPRSTLFPYTTLFRSLFLIANAHYRSRLRLSEESLHAAGEQVRRLQDFARRLKLPVAPKDGGRLAERVAEVRHAYREALEDRKSTRLNSSHDQISYAV